MTNVEITKQEGSPQALKARREALGLLIPELAREASISETELAELEAGSPSTATLVVAATLRRLEAAAQKL